MLLHPSILIPLFVCTTLLRRAGLARSPHYPRDTPDNWDDVVEALLILFVCSATVMHTTSASGEVLAFCPFTDQTGLGALAAGATVVAG